MTFHNSRRRVLAALAAMGVGGLVGAARSEEQGGGLATVPCRHTFTLPSHEPGKGSYSAEATAADFVFYAPMRAQGDNIVLYNPETGATTEAVAAIKGKLLRSADNSLSASALNFAWPHTALDRDGEYFGIVQMAFDQNIPVGLELQQGSTQLGSIEFPKATYDASQPALTLDSATRDVLFPMLMGNDPLTVSLVAGDQVFSSFVIDTEAFRTFAQQDIIAGMDEAKAQDASTPCTVTDGYDEGEMLTEGCFLTTACCAVVGLPDDCWELRALRSFRDEYLAHLPQGAAEISRYYTNAPAIAQRLAKNVAGRKRLLDLYWQTIVPAAICARLGFNRLAHRLYRRMMLDLGA